MNEKTGSGKLLNAQQLLDQLFDAESKPSLRWLREQTRARSIPFVRIGHLVFFDLDIVRSASPVHSITNQVGDVRQARTAPASPEFWAAWRTNKPAMKLAGYSARPTTNGWQAIQYVKRGNQ